MPDKWMLIKFELGCTHIKFKRVVQ